MTISLVSVPCLLDFHFVARFPDEELVDDPRLPWWIRELAQGRKLKRPPSVLSIPPEREKQSSEETAGIEESSTAASKL